MTRPLAVISLIGLALACGCAGSGSRSVTLEVRHPSADAAGDPLANAYVRAIPMAASPVPLPVNSQTLEEMGKLKQDADFTDANGRVTLSFSTIRPFLIEVAAPFGDTTSEGAVWRADFDPRTGALAPQPCDVSLDVRIIN